MDSEQDESREITAMEHPDHGPIEQVREGMRVIDSAGEEIGTVALSRMGDPDAVEDDPAREEEASGGLGNIFGLEFEPDVPAGLQTRLLRAGFVKIDGTGLFSAARYVRADRIADVSGDVVRLSVPRDRIAEAD